MTDPTPRPVTWPIDVYNAKVQDITAYTERMLTSDAPTYPQLEQQLADALATLKETQRQLNERSEQAVEKAQQIVDLQAKCAAKY